MGSSPSKLYLPSSSWNWNWEFWRHTKRHRSCGAGWAPDKNSISNLDNYWYPLILNQCVSTSPDSLPLCQQIEWSKIPLNLRSRGLKTLVAGWHCHPEDLGPSGRFWAMVFWKPVWKIGPNSPKYVRTIQNKFKISPDSSKFVQTAQNLSRQFKICLDCPKCVRKV